MKKLFVIFLSSLYLVLTTGFTQTMHICKEMMMKPLSGMTDHWEVNKPCPFCTSADIDIEKKEDGCCEEASKIVKIDESLKKETNYNFSVKSQSHEISKILEIIFDSTFISDEENRPYLRTQRVAGGNPLYILHCVFRI